MKKAVMNATRLPYLQLVARARQIVQMMTGNDSFPTPNPTLVSVTNAADATEATYNNAKLGGPADREALKTNAAVLRNLLVQMAAYVSNVSNGNADEITSAGFVVSKAHAKRPVPSNIKKLMASMGGVPGQIVLTWGKSVDANFYDVYMGTDPNNASTFVLINSLQARKMLVQNLTSGTRYWFKVVAKNATGTGTETNPVSMIAA